MAKTAIILFNLGGPDKPETVRPFLFNLFNDPAIIRLPSLPRYLLAKLISDKREETAKAIYAKIGGGSPILPNTEAQAKALEKKLGAKCFIAMRYWHPFVEETVKDVKSYAPDQIILLPLYPQFSTTTTNSSLKSWHSAAKNAGITTPTQTICCYPEQEGFITALAERTKKSYTEALRHGKPRILFSAHGLPKKIVEAGDPYPDHCTRTLAALKKTLNIENLDSILCYQSRVGLLKWITPSTDEEIKRAGKDKIPIIIVPIAFVSEHSETLVEIDMEYRHMAKVVGVPYFAYTGTVATDPVFVDGLADLVNKTITSGKACLSGTGERICGNNIQTCPMGENSCCTCG
jgi:ferrochelatase